MSDMGLGFYYDVQCKFTAMYDVISQFLLNIF